jgi:drug/metabolite transporter (DMT)-like permease
MKTSTKKSYIFALLAAALYALSTPIAKLFLSSVSPILLAGLLYFGAGLGMGVIALIRNKFGQSTELPLTKAELPFTLGMVALDILAPILLLIGLQLTSAENASLLNNFEIVATSLIALLLFKEKISKPLWAGIGCITIASILLSVESIASFHFSPGSILVLLATVCWGMENNLTRKMSCKDPLQIVIIKGVFSGLGSLGIAFALGQANASLLVVVSALSLGFIAYGLSIYFYVHSQRTLGAAKTSAFYAVAPFIGVLFSLLIFQELPNVYFFIALTVMILGTYFASSPQKTTVNA